MDAKQNGNKLLPITHLVNWKGYPTVGDFVPMTNCDGPYSSAVELAAGILAMDHGLAADTLNLLMLVERDCSDLHLMKKIIRISV